MNARTMIRSRFGCGPWTLCSPGDPAASCYFGSVTAGAKKLLDEALLLPEDERAELASELLASLQGPPDADWDHAWLVELDRRVADAESSGEVGDQWRNVRERIATRLGK